MEREAFEAELAALGFDEVLTREWPPNHVEATHTHPFEVRALMLHGQLELSCDGEKRTYRSGEIFTLPQAQPHSEQYGPEGAKYLVGRKRVP